MAKWWQRLKSKPYYRFLVVFIGILLIALTVFVWQRASSSRLNSNPAKGTQVELQKLSATTSKLQASFALQGSAKAMKNYLIYMRGIQTSCTRINTYYGTWKAGANKDSADLFNQSHDLCSDLTKLASFSTALYTPLKPLLTADTTPHRYQTLPPFAGHMRSGHSKLTSQALAALKSFFAGRGVNNEVDFPSDAVSNLTQLQNAMTHSSGLGYLPALRTFQLQMAGERERFWVQYASLGDLQQTLKQLTTSD